MLINSDVAAGYIWHSYCTVLLLEYWRYLYTHGAGQTVYHTAMRRLTVGLLRISSTSPLERYSAKSLIIRLLKAALLYCEFLRNMTVGPMRTWSELISGVFKFYKLCISRIALTNSEYTRHQLAKFNHSESRPWLQLQYVYGENFKQGIWVVFVCMVSIAV